MSVPLLADGYEDAFIGCATSHDGQTRAVYDIDACVNVLVERDGMDATEAREFLDFNTIGAYVGDGTPLYVERMSLDSFNELIEEGDDNETE